MTRKIRWTKLATSQFHAAISYIKQDSDQNAEKVREKIISKINGLAEGILGTAKILTKRTMMEVFYILR